MRPCERFSEGPWPARLAVWALLAAGIGLYAGTLLYGPVWDDHVFVQGEPFLSHCGNLLKLISPSALWDPLPVRNAARPVWLASVLADTCLYGGAMPGMRLSSIFLNTACVLAMLLLAFRLSGSRWTAFAAALLFAAHPVHTESVNIITFRTDILAFLFMVPGVLLFLRGRERSGRDRALAWTGAGLCYLFAMLSKEMAATLPLLMLAADRLFPPPGGRARKGPALRLAAVMVVLLAGFLAYRAPRSGYFIGGHVDAFTRLRLALGGTERSRALPGEERPPWDAVYADPAARLRTMSGVFLDYLRLLYWPFHLQGDYSPPVPSRLFDAKALGGLFGWALVLFAAWKLRRGRPLMAFGLLWTAVALLPVSGLVSILNLEAERYLYIPSAGACLFLAGLCAELERCPSSWGRILPVAAPLLLAAAFGTRTAFRNRDYRDEAGYYLATLRADPNVARTHLNLAELYQLKGAHARAERHYRAALASWPSSVRVRRLFGVFLASRGRVDEAAAQFEAAVGLSQTPGPLWSDLGRVYLIAGREKDALAAFERALETDPDSESALIHAGRLEVRIGDAASGISKLKRAAALSGWRSAAALHALWAAAREVKDGRTADRAFTALRRADPELAERLSR